MGNLIVELYNYREMILSLTKRELRGRYKASFLGFLWTFILPLGQLLIYTIVFSVILRNDIEKFYLFLFVALIPWNFFANCLTAGANCVLMHQNLVAKIYFPREVLPISFVNSSFINMMCGYAIVFIVCLFSGVNFELLGLISLIIAFFNLYILALGVTLILSSITVYVRDIEHIMGLLSMAWMFMTPIMYSMEMIPQKLLFVFKLNPMTYVINSLRLIMYYGMVPNLNDLLISSLIGISFLLVGLVVFGRLKRGFAEEM